MIVVYHGITSKRPDDLLYRRVFDIGADRFAKFLGVFLTIVSFNAQNGSVLELLLYLL